MARFVQKRDLNSIFYFIALFIFVAFVGFTVSGDEGLIRLYQVHKQKKGLEEVTKSLLLENLTYRQELKSLRTGKRVDIQAHESLGLAYPDEVVWIVSGEK
ncbi:MAG: septum formation initiator family protein [Deltaproteobacteria bacterium]|nr:septum formation initiator family protein [Deltaproteobacteria bacterium]